MRNEILRQLVHLIGLAFIPIAWVAGKEAAGILFLLAAFWFLLYSQHVRTRERSRKGLLPRMEARMRDLAFLLERKDAKPFSGAFWFYFGLGLAFLLFPLSAASAAGATLAVSDSLSTIIGKKFGKKRIIGKKTLEGSFAFLISSFLICLVFVNPAAALAGSLAATFAELLPEARPISRSRLSGLLDDNFLIPIIAGFAIAIMVLA